MSLLYFSDKEVAGLVEPTPTMLDQLRGYLGLPVILTFTTGGVHCGHSSHYIGAAVDAGTGHIPDGSERHKYNYLFVKAAQSAGFKRVEICPAHIHVDTGDIVMPGGEYPAPVLFIGQEA